MRKFALFFLAFVVACSLAGSARADKDSTCEAYALSVMGQIKQSEKHEECRERGFFKGDRWRNDFKYHYNKCAERYDAATDRHRAFTQNEKEATTAIYRPASTRKSTARARIRKTISRS
jgi:hypothetical protein